MRVSFHSIIDNNKVYFQSNVDKIDNQYVFIDKTLNDTKMIFEIKESDLIIRREGSTHMQMLLKENEKTKGSYQNELGLAFDFEVICTSLEITKNRINVEYKLILEEECISNH